MSHVMPECNHAFGPWSTELVLNAAGEQQYRLERRCYTCGLVEVEPAMIREEQ